MNGSRNYEIAKIFYEMSGFFEIKGEAFRARAYRRAAKALEELTDDIISLYEARGLKSSNFKKIAGIGESTAKKIEEYIKTGEIKDHTKLEKETAIRQLIAHYFKSRGIGLAQLKNDAKKEKIVYSRYTRPAKQLLELAGSVKNAKRAIDKVAEWANSRKLDYSIETIFKKWPELDRLKPKEIVKKPFYDNLPMVWSETKKKWYVINSGGEWLEFAGRETDIEWRVQK